MVEALAARPVIEGDPAAMMGTTLDPQRRPTPRTEGVDLPDAAEAVFARALALDPRARQRDAGVFWNELVAALQVPNSERGLALQRDSRAEEGGGVRVERVEVRSRSSGTISRVPQPSAAVEQALAMDLEFDPTSVPARAGSVSETRPSTPAPPLAVGNWVPDLELAPPPVSRKPSGARPALGQPNRTPTPASRAAAASSGAHPPLIDLDDAHPPLIDLDDAHTIDLDGAHTSGRSLDLDLPADEPLARRAASTPGMRAVQVTRRSSPPPRRASQPPPPPREAPVPVSGVMPTPAGMGELGSPGPVSARGQRRSVPPAAPEPASADRTLDTGFVAKVEVQVPDEQPLGRRLRLPLVVLAVSISVTIFDPVYAALTGEKLEILGVRPGLFGGLLLLVALALAGREVFREP
jgi:hypothetical protein